MSSTESRLCINIYKALDALAQDELFRDFWFKSHTAHTLIKIRRTIRPYDDITRGPIFLRIQQTQE